MESGQENKLFTKEQRYELEYEAIRLIAAKHEDSNISEFRKKISRICNDTYVGERSIDGFVKIATAIIKDEEGHFQLSELPTQTLFINSLKSEDIDLEVLREMKENMAQLVPEYNLKSQNLIKMIKGLVVIYT